MLVLVRAARGADTALAGRVAAVGRIVCVGRGIRAFVGRLVGALVGTTVGRLRALVSNIVAGSIR